MPNIVIRIDWKPFRYNHMRIRQNLTQIKKWIKIPKAESYAESYAEYENMPDAWNAFIRALL